MSQDSKLLQAFLSVVRSGWLERLCKATYSDVKMQQVEEGVQVTSDWVNRDKTCGHWGKLYPKDIFFGSTLQLSWEAHEVVLRPCDFHRTVVRDILNQRGVR